VTLLRKPVAVTRPFFYAMGCVDPWLCVPTPKVNS
jgi:hypothetical protein